MAQPKLSELVDEGYDLKFKIKPLDKRLKEIKSRLQAHGRKFKQDKIDGDKAECRFGIQPTVNADTKKVYEAYVDAGIEDAFWDAISVQVGKLEADLGKAQADRLKKVKRDPWGRVNFIKKK
jgi:hypothetical protein